MRGPSPHDPEGVFTRPRRPEWPEAPFLNDDVPAAPSAPVPGEVDERARVRLVVVMPVGPGEDLHDTLASVNAYTEASRAIVLVNDTGRGASGPAPEADAETGVHVVPAPAGATGSRGGLWVKIAAGYRYACERFAFDLVLRMDTDALMLGPGIEEAALRRFADDPRLGLLGSYRVGPDGGRRDFGPPARTLARESGLLGLGRPRLRAQQLTLLEHARGAGYAPGEHALGGAFLHSAAAARALPGPRLARSAAPRPLAPRRGPHLRPADGRSRFPGSATSAVPATRWPCAGGAAGPPGGAARGPRPRHPLRAGLRRPRRDRRARAVRARPARPGRSQPRASGVIERSAGRQGLRRDPNSPRCIGHAATLWLNRSMAGPTLHPRRPGVGAAASAAASGCWGSASRWVGGMPWGGWPGTSSWRGRRSAWPGGGAGAGFGPWSALRSPVLAVWLLLLPNAPYLVTDLVHLEGRAPAVPVIDIPLFAAFAATGLVIFLVCLHLVHRPLLRARRRGRRGR